MNIIVIYEDKESEKYIVNTERLEVFLRELGIEDTREDLEISLSHRINDSWGTNPPDTGAIFMSPGSIGLFTFHGEVNEGLLRMLYHYMTDLEDPHDIWQEVQNHIPEEERPSIIAANDFAEEWKHLSLVTALT